MARKVHPIFPGAFGGCALLRSGRGITTDFIPFAGLTGSEDLAPGGVLTQADRETVAHLIRRGMGRNTVRAIRSDLEYLEAWSIACDGAPLPWPPPREVILRFIAHHLWDPEERRRHPDHGMPGPVEAVLRASGHLRAAGPHAPATVRRRISTWRSLCKWRDLGDPFDDGILRKALASAARAADRPPRRKSERAVTADVIGHLMEHLSRDCGPVVAAGRDARRLRLGALRDRAMLAISFASGGRRRSEISELMMGQLEPREPIPDEETGRTLPSLGIRMGRTKTTDAGEDLRVYVTGAPVTYLEAWLAAAEIAEGPVFRRIDRWGRVFAAGIGERALNRVLKQRLAEIGEDPARFSAHGIRAGFITEALARGLSPQEVMGQTLHRSVQTTMSYYNDAHKRTGRAARLLE